MTEQKPVRLPDPASVETVLAGLEPQSADVELSPALNKAFPGFVFTVATIDDPYWCNPHDVVAADGTRLGDHRAWFEHELAEVGGDLNAFGIGIARAGKNSPNGAAPPPSPLPRPVPASPTSCRSRSAARSSFWPAR